MMVHLPALLAILAMALVTYLTRIAGYLLLAGRRLSPRLQAVMDLIPGCVLVAVIAPNFATGRPADLLGLVATILAATRFSLLPHHVIRDHHDRGIARPAGVSERLLSPADAERKPAAERPPLPPASRL